MAPSWTDLDTAISSSARQLWFWGEPGHSYAFRMRGIDKQGNAESYPSTAETTTQIPAICTPDSYEDADDDPGSAAPILPGETQTHNSCSTNDADWVILNAEAGKTYLVTARPSSSHVAGKLSIYGPGNSIDLVAENAAVGPDTISGVVFTATVDGDYYLLLQPFDDRLNGTQTELLLNVVDAEQQFFPIVR